MRQLVAVTLVFSLTVVAAIVPPAGYAAGTPAQRCAAAKLKATGKKAAARLKCWEKAIGAGIPVDPLCLTKAEDKFELAFTKAEEKGGCSTVGDAPAIQTTVVAFVDDVVADLQPVVRLSTDVQPIFSASCATSGCHSGSFPAGELNLQAGTAWSATVDVASSEIPSLKRVLPGDAENSYLYQKITGAPGIVGQPMPFGSFPLPQVQIDTIAAWIVQGAQNN